MRNKWIVSGIGVILTVALIAGFTIVLQSGHVTVARPAASHTSATALPNPYGCPNVDLPGTPFLKPTGTGPVAFTEQDVRMQIMERVQAVAQSTHTQIQYVIDNVAFMTSLQACTLLKGVETGRPLDAMVIVVVEHFTYLTGPSAGTKGKDTSVFDAHTGNNMF